MTPWTGLQRRGACKLGQAAHTRDGARSVPQRSGWDPSLLDAAAGDGTTNTDVPGRSPSRRPSAVSTACRRW